MFLSLGGGWGGISERSKEWEGWEEGGGKGRGGEKGRGGSKEGRGDCWTLHDKIMFIIFASIYLNNY